jgi:6-O-methylguanine DNA methyltransferase, DNA binding domain
MVVVSVPWILPTVRCGCSSYYKNAIHPSSRSKQVAIVIPCDRVIGAKAKLIGYAGGLDRKQCLLQHEGAELGVESCGCALEVSSRFSAPSRELRLLG